MHRANDNLEEQNDDGESSLKTNNGQNDVTVFSEILKTPHGSVLYTVHGQGQDGLPDISLSHLDNGTAVNDGDNSIGRTFCVLDMSTLAEIDMQIQQCKWEVAEGKECTPSPTKYSSVEGRSFSKGD